MSFFDEDKLIDEISELREKLELAEAQLKEAREQKPVAWLHDKYGRADTCHDSVKQLWIKVGQKQNTQFMREIVPCKVEHYNIPLYARPVPATVAVPAEWREVMAELASDLQAACDAEHPHRDKYPSVMRKYQNDMDIVEKARALLQSLDGVMFALTPPPARNPDRDASSGVIQPTEPHP